MDDLDLSNFPTSDLLPEPFIRDEADQAIDKALLALKLERAVVLVKCNGAWTVASAHEIPIKDFWNLAPLSLSVVHHVASSGKSICIMDAGASGQFSNKNSMILTGVRSVACTPYQDAKGEVKALIYVDNRANQGAFTDNDGHKLEELAQELGDRLFKTQA